MDLRKAKNLLDKKMKEICRQLNNQPIDVFVEAFDRLGVFKEYEQIYGSWKALQAQTILQKLKEDHLPRRAKGQKLGKRRALRFIIAVKGLWQGKHRNIWVITSSALSEDIRRFQEHKLRIMQEQANLFDDWQDEMEHRTGESQQHIGAQMQELLDRMRRHLGLNGHDTGPSLPPGPDGELS